MCYFSQPLLNRCIPVHIRNFQKWVSNNIIAFLNKADIFQKVLGDLYASWQEMIALCFVALGNNILIILSYLLLELFSVFHFVCVCVCVCVWCGVVVVCYGVLFVGWLVCFVLWL